jgi:hypothetical protein
VSKAQPAALLRAELKAAKERAAELVALLVRIRGDVNVYGEIRGTTQDLIDAAIAKAKGQS